MDHVSTLSQQRRTFDLYPWEHPPAGRNERTEAASEYLVIYEHDQTGWGAYCPDLPGLGVADATREEVEGLIHDATGLHIESLREHNEPVPPPRARPA
jgi:predicted RNase H-like HicB family nuclease